MFKEKKSFMYIFLSYLLAIIVLVIVLNIIGVNQYNKKLDKNLVKSVKILEPIIGYNFNLHATGPNSYTKKELIVKARLVNAVVKQMGLMGAGSGKLINGIQYMTMAQVPNRTLDKGSIYNKNIYGKVYWNNFSMAGKKVYKESQNAAIGIYKLGTSFNKPRWHTSAGLEIGRGYNLVGTLPNGNKYNIGVVQSLKNMKSAIFWIYFKNISIGIIIFILSTLIFFYVRKTTEEQEKKRFAKTQEYLEDEIDKKTKALKKKTLELEETNGDLIVANKTKDTFLSKVSHEFRTPLQSILGFSNILENSLYESNLQQSSMNFNNNEIKKAAIFMTEMTNNIFTFTKKGQKNIIEPKSVFAPKEIFQSIMSIYSLISESTNIILRLEKSNNIPLFVKSHRNKIFQIINNLIQNAFKYSESGGIVTIKTEFKDNTLIMEVKDTGIGISKENLNKIFDEYYQTNKFSSGVGIGLNLVKTFVDEMDGKIEVESKVGKGSSFKISIPIEVVDSNPVIEDFNTWKRRTANENVARLYEYLELFLGGLKEKIKKVDLQFEKNQVYDENLVRKLCHFIEGMADELYLFELSSITKKIREDDFKNNEKIAELLNLIKKNMSALYVYHEEKIYFKNKILIVDDCDAIIKYYSDILDQFNLKYDIAQDGETALDLALKNKYSLILTDITMPKMTGDELLWKLKENNIKSKVMCFTADFDTEKYIQMGFDNVLSKPISRVELIITLQNFSEKKDEKKHINS